MNLPVLPGAPSFRLVLAVTYRCNLRCPYCYVKLTSSTTMPFETAARAVELALEALPDGGALYLAFFGGEPLLEPELIARAVAHARARGQSRGIRVFPRLTTNGTCLTPETLAMLQREEFEVTLSLDGVPAAHDRNRFLASGAGSFALVEEGIQRARAAGMALRANMVVDPSTVRDLARGVEHVLSMGVTEVELSPNYDADWDDAALAVMDAQYRQIGAAYTRSMSEGRRFALGFLETKLAVASRGGYQESEHCAFGVGEMAVDPVGRIFPCERLIRDGGGDEMVIGRLPEGIDAARLARIRAPRGVLTSECQDCGLNGMCTNWCACVNYSRTGAINEPDGLVCFIEDLCTSVAEDVARSVIPRTPALAGGDRP